MAKVKVTPEEILQKNISKLTTRIYTLSTLRELQKLATEEWGIPPSLTLSKFEDLITNAGGKRVQLQSEFYKSVSRLILPMANEYDIALSLRKNSYLCQATAVFLHGLNDQIPKTIYVNHEQSQKPKRITELSQRGIDNAFSRPQRTSRYSFKYEEYRIVLLSGKNTKRLGVIPIALPDSSEVDVTDLSRTLIDIVVRPSYAGGIFQVMKCFQAARSKVTASDLLEMLNRLDYTYPYHQAIGFLMERSGFSSSDLGVLQAKVSEFDFYLVYGMREPLYDSKWRLFYPKGL